MAPAARRRARVRRRAPARDDANASFQLILDLVDAGLHAGLVLLATRRTGRTGSTDHLVADLDRQRAAPGGEAGEVLRAHLRIILQALFHLARGDAEGARGERLLEAV